MNDAATRAMTLEDRFLAKVRKDPSGCWIWCAHQTKGYGSFWFRGANIGAHRAAYEIFVGPIPDGLQIDHLCNVPLCVNPQHLEPVTCEVNLMRGQTWASRNAQKTHCPHGHPYSGDNLRYTKIGGRYCLACKRRKSAENRARLKAKG